MTTITDFPEHNMITINVTGYNEEGQHSQIHDKVIYGYYGNNRDGKDAKYEKVINNILNFLEIKKKLKKNFPLVRVSFIVMENNKHEIENFKNFL